MADANPIASPMIGSLMKRPTLRTLDAPQDGPRTFPALVFAAVILSYKQSPPLAN
jgi:hypothetical protein